MKKVFYWFGGLAAVLAVGVFVAVQIIDADFISEKVSQAVKKSTGTPLEFISAPSITLLPPGVEFGELRWDAVKDKQGARFTAKGGKASVALAPLLHGDIVISEVALNAPAVDVYLPESSAKSASSTPSSETKSSEAFTLPSSLPFELKMLNITEGSLSCMQGERQYSLKNLEVSLQNLRANAEADLSCAFNYTLPYAGQDLTGALDLSTKANLFTAKPSIRNLSLKVTPSDNTLPHALGPIQLTGDASFDQEAQTLTLNALSLALPKANAEFTGAVHLKDLSAQGAFRLEATLRSLAALFGVTLPGQASYDVALKGNVKASAQDLALSSLEGKLDETTIKSNIDIAFGNALSVKGTLALGDLKLDSYLPSTPEKDEPAQKSPAKPAAKENKSMALPALDLRLDMASLSWHGLKAESLQGILRGSQGNYTLEKLAFSLASGGTLLSSGRANLNQNDYAMALTAKDVNIGPLMEALGKGRAINGKAHTHADLTAKGSSAEALIASLSGSGEITAQDINVKALTELLQGIPVFKKLATLTFAQVHAPFTVSKGVLKVSPATATSEAIKATANATVNLPKQNVKATVTINALDMSVPINIEGPFTNLSYTLDPRFTMGVLKGVGEALLNGGKNAGSATTDKAKDTEKAVKDVGKVLKGLFAR